MTPMRPQRSPDRWRPSANVRSRLGFGRSAAATGAGAATWLHQGDEANAADGLSGLLSAICDKRFYEAPKIANELLNRKVLSSPAAAARLRLIERMFAAADQPLFGIDPDKAPPEKSMFLSVIEAGGIQKDLDGVLGLTLPPKATIRSRSVPPCSRSTASSMMPWARGSACAAFSIAWLSRRSA